MAILRKLLEAALAWLLASLWKRAAPKVLSLSVPIGGTNLPLSAIAPLAAAVFPAIEEGLNAGKSKAEIVADVNAAIPAALISVSETVLNILFPGVGTIEAGVVWIVENVQTPEGKAFINKSAFTAQDPRFSRSNPADF